MNQQLAHADAVHVAHVANAAEVKIRMQHANVVSRNAVAVEANAAELIRR